MADIIEKAGGGGPGANAKTIVVPGSSISQREMAGPYTDLAKAVGAVGDTLIESDRSRVEALGRSNVTLDENGEPKVSQVMEWTQNDRAYNAAARQSALAMRLTKTEEDLQGLRQQFDGDPAGFRAASAAYIKNIKMDKETASVIGPLVSERANAIGSAHYRGMLEKAHDTDVRGAYDTMSQRLSVLNGRIEQIVMQGGTDSDEYKQAIAERQDLLGQVGSNPKFRRFGATPERIAVENEQFTTRMKAMGIVGAARSEYERAPNEAGILRRTESELRAMGLPEKEVQEYIGRVRVNISGAGAIRTVERQRLAGEASLLIEKLKSGDTLNNEEYDKVVNGLAVYGGQKQAAELAFARTFHEQIRPMLEYGTPQERAEAMEKLRGLQQTGVQVPGGRAPAGAGRIVDVGGRAEPANFRNMEPEAQAQARRLASAFGGDLTITPHGGRQPDKRASTSQHPAGRAMDINIQKMSDAERTRLVATAIANGAVGLGTYSVGQGVGTIHVDWRKVRGKEPDGLAIWHRQGLGKDSGLETAPAWFQEGVRQGRAMKAAGQGAAPMPAAGPAQVGVMDLPVPKGSVEAAQRSYEAFFKSKADGVIAAIERGDKPTQEEIDDLTSMAPFVTGDENKGVIKKLVEAERKANIGRTVNQSGPLAEVERAYEAGKAAAQSGQLGAPQREALKVMGEAITAKRKMLAEDPLEAGRLRFRDAESDYGAASAIDWSNPASIDRELQLRRRQSDIVRATDPEASHMPLYASELPGLAGAVRGGDAKQVTAIGQALQARLSKEQLVALMGHKETREAFIAGTRGGDPAKMNASFAFMDNIYRANPQEFARVFDQTSEKRLAMWQTMKDYLTPEQVAERFMKAADPSDKALSRSRDEAAKEALDKKKAGDLWRDLQGVPGFLSPSNIIQPAARFTATPPRSDRGDEEMQRLKFSYDEAYKSHFRDFGDADAAGEYAKRVVGRTWGDSVVSGGALMRHPPERYVPKVNGSHDWLQDQLKTEVAGVLGVAPDARASGRMSQFQVGTVGTPQQEFAAGVLKRGIFLVADQNTETEVASGKPPSYRIIAYDKDGKLTALEKAPGNPYRFRPDATAAQNAARAKMMERRPAALEAQERGRTMGIGDIGVP